MVCFLDTNTLIHWSLYDFPLEEKKDFWQWLINPGKSGKVKIFNEVREVVKKRNHPKNRQRLINRKFPMYAPV